VNVTDAIAGAFERAAQRRDLGVLAVADGSSREIPRTAVTPLATGGWKSRVALSRSTSGTRRSR
jgi:hypothetical protein